MMLVHTQKAHLCARMHMLHGKVCLLCVVFWLFCSSVMVWLVFKETLTCLVVFCVL